MPEPYKEMIRYTVPVDGRPHTLQLNSDPVAASYTHGTITSGIEFWAEWHRSLPVSDRMFRVYGPRHEIPADATWRGTVRDQPGLAWHLYELPAEPTPTEEP